MSTGLLKADAYHDSFDGSQCLPDFTDTGFPSFLFPGLIC